MLTPDEIMARDFLVSLRGYDREEVQDFLAEVAGDVRAMRDRIEELEAQLASAHERAGRDAAGGEMSPDRFDKATAFRLLGEETTRILVAAEDSASEIRTKAEREAQERIDDARTTARTELEDARRTAARVVAEAEHVRDRALEEVRDVETARDQLLDELRAAIERVHGAVTDLEDTEIQETVNEIPPPPRPETVGEDSAPTADAEITTTPAPEPPPTADATPPAAAGSTPDTAPATGAAPETAPAAEPAPEREPTPEPEPAPEAVTETVTEAEPGSVTGTEPGGESRVDAAAEPDMAEPETEVAVEAAPEAVASAPSDAAPDQGTPGDVGASTVTAATEPPVTGDVPEPETAAEPEGRVAVDVSPVQLREQTLATVRPGMLRRVKRTLQDVQNEVLTAIREAGPDADVADLLPGDGDFEQLDAVGDMFLTAAFRGGVGDAASLADDELDDEVGDGQVVATRRRSFRDELEHEVGAGLRATLRAGLEAAESEPQLSERVGEVFRDLKGPVVEGLVDRTLVATYSEGQLAAWERLGMKSSDWVLADEARCPEGRCRINQSEGSVPLGEEFPSGDTVPPAHPGCTCGLSPAG